VEVLDITAQGLLFGCLLTFRGPGRES
jgi:hypothetical protein